MTRRITPSPIPCWSCENVAKVLASEPEPEHNIIIEQEVSEFVSPSPFGFVGRFFISCSCGFKETTRLFRGQHYMDLSAHELLAAIYITVVYMAYNDGTSWWARLL